MTRTYRDDARGRVAHVEIGPRTVTVHMWEDADPVASLAVVVFDTPTSDARTWEAAHDATRAYERALDMFGPAALVAIRAKLRADAVKASVSAYKAEEQA